MRTRFVKLIFSLILISIIVFPTGFTSFADSREYKASNYLTDETINVSFDGITVTSVEDFDLGLNIFGAVSRGDTIEITFTWNNKTKSNRTAQVWSSDAIPENNDDLSGVSYEKALEKSEFFNQDGSLPWSKVVSKSDDSITLKVTAPTDTKAKMFHISASGMCSGRIPVLMACAVHITLDDSSVAPSDRFQTKTRNADKTSGEDEGVTIDNEIVDGIDVRDIASKIAVPLGGALIAVGFLGAATGNKDSSKEDKKKKAYRMKVYKNFGDSIRRGAQPVAVWARIVEVTEGTEIDRPDLSEKITVSCTGMNIHSVGMQNSYMGCYVSVPMDSTADKATLTFTFSGEGGVFHNNVVFNVIGEPKIIFPSMSEDGNGWIVSSDISRVNMIAGLGGRERLRFIITNTDQEPKVIRFKDHDGFEITCEKDLGYAFTYYACIENHTSPIEKESGIFAAEKSIKVTVEAEFEDGMTADNYFTIMLYPEGLSVTAENIENGRMIVDTVPSEKQEDLREPIPPTVFFITLAYLDRNGNTVIKENPGFSNGELTDDGRYNLLFKENFDYSIAHRSSSGIAFYPKQTLPSLGDPYEVRLPISVFEDETGINYKADIPIAVLGEVPKPVYSDADRQRELKLLKKAIGTYGLDGNPEVKAMVMLATSGFASVDEIQDAHRAVIKSAVSFYYDYGDAYQNMSALYTKYIVVAGTMVNAGDYALEYLLKVKLGGYGGLTANIINPLKNLLATYIGEYYANGNIDKAPDFTKTMLKGCDDALYSAISGVLFGGLKNENEANFSVVMGGKRLSVTGNAYEEIQKILGNVISVYIMIRFTDHYLNGKSNEKGDVFRSMVAACEDLSLKLLKAFVLQRLEKAMSRVFEKLVKWSGDIFKKFCQGSVNQAVLEAGNKAFGKKIQEGLSKDGYVSNATYWAAKSAKALAKKNTFIDAMQKYDPKPFTDAVINGTYSITSNKYAGMVLSMLLDPWNESGYKVESTKDVVISNVEKKLTDYMKTNLGITPEKIYAKSLDGLNPLEVTVRLEDGLLIIGMLGYYIEILMTGENFMAIAEMAFESMFSWLDAFWDMMSNSTEVPDPRKQVEKNIDRVKEEMEKQRQRMESLEDVTFVYDGE